MYKFSFAGRFASKWRKLATTGCATASTPRTGPSVMARTKKRTYSRQSSRASDDAVELLVDSAKREYIEFGRKQTYGRI